MLSGNKNAFYHSVLLFFSQELLFCLFLLGSFAQVYNKRAGACAGSLEEMWENMLSCSPHERDLHSNVFDGGEAVSQVLAGCICMNAYAAEHMGCLVILITNFR